MLASLGFPRRTRGDHGNFQVEFDRTARRRIHELAVLHAVRPWASQQPDAPCPLCQEFRLLSQGEAKALESLKPAEDPVQPSEYEQHHLISAEGASELHQATEDANHASENELQHPLNETEIGVVEQHDPAGDAGQGSEEHQHHRQEDQGPMAPGE